MIDVRVQSGPFDPGRQLQRLDALHPAAVASFTGTVAGGDDMETIIVEHYAVLAKAELAAIASEAEGRWPLKSVILIHRHGRFSPGERVLFAAAAADDADAATQACAFLVEALRTRAPFWRKDLLAGGGSRWV